MKRLCSLLSPSQKSILAVLSTTSKIGGICGAGKWRDVRW
jgi:hypothetical protein